MPDQDRPNFLIIMSDQHHRQALGCYGNPVIQTPNIDALAREGMRFDHCYAQYSLCVPSRGSILTSRYVHIRGATTLSKALPAWEFTFPQILSENGYHTASIGKMHFLPYTKSQGLSDRFIVESKAFTGDDEYRKYMAKLGLEYRTWRTNPAEFKEFFSATAAPAFDNPQSEKALACYPCWNVHEDNRTIRQ